MPTITVEACAEYAYAAGFRGEPLVTIVALAGPESGYDTTAHNTNAATHDDSYGLWQINLFGSLGPDRRRRYGLRADTDLFDPAINARAAWDISGGGTNFAGPWATSYKGGKHRPFLNAARAAAQAVEARGGGFVAAGSGLLASSAPGQLAGEVVPPGGGIADNTAVQTTFPRIGLNGISVAEMEAIGRMGVAGRVQLSVEQTSQIRATYADPNGPIRSWGSLLPRADARYGEFRLTVANVSWDDLDGIAALTVDFESIAVAALRRPDPTGASAMWTDLSPTEVLAQRAAFYGLRFYGKATARRAQILRAGKDDAGRDKAESDWDMGERLAQEEGFWFFEAADALYFAPPTWLLGRTTEFEVRWDAEGAKAAWNCLGIPSLRQSIDEQPGYLARTVEVDLPRWRGEQVRPGMTMRFVGVATFNARYIVTEVTWELDGGVTPVHVTATDALDPVPKGDPDLGALVGSAGSNPDGFHGVVGGLLTTPSDGGGVSGGGRGSYGYQYDPPGNTASGGPQPGAVVLRDHLRARFKFGSSSIYVNRPVDGTDKLSVHAEGRAIDCMEAVNAPVAGRIADYVVANASLFGVQYVIWNKRSWKATDNPRQWKPYRPPNGRTDATSEHRDHVHIELCWEAARNLNAHAIAAATSAGAGGGGGGGGSF